ncbi:hypothetical protein EWU23_11200 [Cytophagaceae bacterium 50C-KIRBA]|uniref:Tetratricopeptide repeat protein n=1 Tax=Aquirufa beregesia TaxID=2516556 RepID=A0ABX0EZK9_9BACT|nr:hypothetical protein [Aquirufa beregesia]NGZ45042.1 hypothetical protein [Aquirufa beregesia]
MKKRLIVLLTTLLFPALSWAQENMFHEVQKISWKTHKDSLQKIITYMNNHPSNDYYYLYWTAYAHYMNYFNYKLSIPAEEKKAHQCLEQASKILSQITKPNSETMALQSLIDGLKLNFTNIFLLPIKAGKVGKLAERAIDLNPKNPRAYYALAIYDFYTPKMYGGRKQVESNLIKAISLSTIVAENSKEPQWCIIESYLFLIRYFKEENQKNKAQHYLQEAKTKFPENTTFLQYKL